MADVFRYLPQDEYDKLDTAGRIEYLSAALQYLRSLTELEAAGAAPAGIISSTPPQPTDLVEASKPEAPQEQPSAQPDAPDKSASST